MGESYFEVEFAQTLEQIKELYRFHFFRKPSSLALNIATCCIFFLYIFRMIFLSVDLFDVVILVILLLLIPLYLLVYRLTVKHMVKRQHELCGEQDVQARFGFYNDSFVMNESTGAQFNIDYSSIKCCYQTKNLFLLYSKANMIYSIPKDAFTKGNPAYFIPFITSRGVKVK